ncbi:MAG: hypothetical protein RLZZ67_453 [Candidatus Parcubacteria bacterium]|jgi:murein DD-endopeptidase MepM/ murein hydrolase activator NlpD
MKLLFKTLFITSFFLPLYTYAGAINVTPEKPLQGEPVLITITATSSVSSLSFNGKRLSVFTYKNKPTALHGVDLYTKPGTYKVTARLADGTTLSRGIEVVKRDQVVAPLGIPAKLGGNTEKAATKLVNTLATENASLIGLRTGTHAFWTKQFIYPTQKPFVTDEYEYSRQTGSYSIAHKGTDFRAATGTPILAMNRGVIRLVQEGRNYGKTIVIDHGLGVQTLYMHLSKIHVEEGQLVLPGQVIGLSGMTGYAEQPHLHLSLRINEVSIDPLKFMALLQ